MTSQKGFKRQLKDYLLLHIYLTPCVVSKTDQGERKLLQLFLDYVIQKVRMVLGVWNRQNKM